MTIDYSLTCGEFFTSAMLPPLSASTYAKRHWDRADELNAEGKSAWLHRTVAIVEFLPGGIIFGIIERIMTFIYNVFSGYYCSKEEPEQPPANLNSRIEQSVTTDQQITSIAETALNTAASESLPDDVNNAPSEGTIASSLRSPARTPSLPLDNRLEESVTDEGEVNTTASESLHEDVDNTPIEEVIAPGRSPASTPSTSSLPLEHRSEEPVTDEEEVNTTVSESLQEDVNTPPAEETIASPLRSPSSTPPLPLDHRSEEPVTDGQEVTRIAESDPERTASDSLLEEIDNTSTKEVIASSPPISSAPLSSSIPSTSSLPLIKEAREKESSFVNDLFSMVGQLVLDSTLETLSKQSTQKPTGDSAANVELNSAHQVSQGNAAPTKRGVTFEENRNQTHIIAKVGPRKLSREELKEKARLDLEQRKEELNKRKPQRKANDEVLSNSSLSINEKENSIPLNEEQKPTPPNTSTTKNRRGQIGLDAIAALRLQKQQRQQARSKQ